MGYQGKLELKVRAQQLRQHGYSYSEILETTPVSKNTISRWCRDIVLSPQQEARLIESKNFGQHKGSIVAAENKRKKRLESVKKYQDQGLSEVGTLSKRDRFLIGIALYAGEGDKSGGKIGFTNADPKMIKFMVTWLREFLNIPQEKLRGAIWLHEGLDEAEAKNFWSNLTEIPVAQFHKTYVSKVKGNSPKIRKNIHPYGVFSVRVSDTFKQRQIMGWIFGLLVDTIPPVH